MSCILSVPQTTHIVLIWLLVASQGVVHDIVRGSLHFPIITLLPQWFVWGRWLATGIILLESGVGSIAFLYLRRALLSQYGFHWTLRI